VSSTRRNGKRRRNTPICILRVEGHTRIGNILSSDHREALDNRSRVDSEFDKARWKRGLTAALNPCHGRAPQRKYGESVEIVPMAFFKVQEGVDRRVAHSDQVLVLNV
jgi:hypothetical protein